MGAPTRRQRQLGELLHQELSLLIQRRSHDPRLKFVTITEVSISQDLRDARVYFTILGDEKRAIAGLEGLRHAAGFFRREIGNNLELRIIPELQFVRDDSFERGMRIDKILDYIEEENHSANNDQ